MVGFYDDSYQELRRYKRKKNAVLIFFALILVCFLLRWSPLPAPFSATLGNDLSMALIGAFASVGVVLALDLIEFYEDVLDRCWRLAMKVHDYAYSTEGTWFLPFYYSTEEATELIYEMERPRINAPWAKNHHQHWEHYHTARSEYDDFFRSQPADQQNEMMLVEINRWKDEANNQAAHYYRMKQAVESMIKLDSLLRALPKTGPIKGFLRIVQISRDLIKRTEFEYENWNYTLGEHGWDNGNLNIYGVESCASKMGPHRVYTICGEQCLAQEDQAELYLILLEISKMPFSFPPKDEEFYSPWGASFRGYDPRVFQR